MVFLDDQTMTEELPPKVFRGSLSSPSEALLRASKCSDVRVLHCQELWR